jgi:hypothetical protein
MLCWGYDSIVQLWVRHKRVPHGDTETGWFLFVCQGSILASVESVHSRSELLCIFPLRDEKLFHIFAVRWDDQ